MFLFISCSSDDKDPDVAFNSLSANKTDLYIEDVATINVDGTGYTEMNLTSTNSKIKITKVASNLFEVSSTGATTATLYAELKNNSYNKIKSITINFAEHGVINFSTIEGITLNIDKTDKILNLLGDPEVKSDSPNGTSVNWIYPQKGIIITIDKNTNIANLFNLLSSYYFYTNSENVKINYTDYPYEIGNGWKINSTNTTMDMVVNALGLPTAKNTSTSSPTNRGYQFSNNRRWFRFYSNSEDNYTGKRIIQCTIY